MRIISELLIGGEWSSGVGREPVFDPSDDSVIAEVAIASEAQCMAALDAAAAAQPEFAATSPRVRSDILRRGYELMLEEADALAELITRENGKSLKDSHDEVAIGAEFLRWFSEEAAHIPGDYRESPDGTKRIMVTHYPVGPSLLVTPWNFPASMAIRKFGPALAAGCTTILKPAPDTPLSALAIADLLQRAGAPAGVVNVIMPEDVGPTTEKLMHDRRLRCISFTGSTAVGTILLRSAADQVLRTSMELGGNAPFVVLGDADVDVAVEGAMMAKMRNGGCACTAANRLIVAEELAEEFTSKFSAAMATVRMGPGLDPDTQLGSMVSSAERDKVAALVAGAEGEGARVLVGGEVPAGGGSFYPATVLSDVQPDAEILKHEIFGPVAPIVTASSDEEAIAIANDTDFGLISYVFGGDMRRSLRAAEGIESGMVSLNRGIILDPAAPIGGVKFSGLGREGGFEGVHEFLETKYIGFSR